MSTPLPRDEFAVTQRYSYLNHAAVGVLPASSLAAIETLLRAHADAGVLGTFPYDARMPEYRRRIAGFVGASEGEIAIVPSTSAGANVVALGIDWRPGDEVLLCDNEFPSNAVPWVALRKRGVAVRWIESARERLTPDVLRREIGPQTRAVAVSWVSYDDGYRHDLAGLSEVAHAAGAWLCVDAIQALGAFPLDVRHEGIDALYSGAGKWMLGLHGAGFLYLREALIDRLAVAAPGWRSMEDMWAFSDYEQPYSPAALRFEGGTPNFVGALALDQSIALFERCDPGAIARHVLELTDRLCAGLERAGARLRTLRGAGISSGIVTFEMPDRDSVALGRALQREGLVTTYWPSGIRCAPHGYNTPEDVDRLLELLPRLAEV
ncbi:MAG TPA: aminotransferase class V-fold PLP-dependent enzyme [Candidatus Tumulicola sp.]